MFHVQPSKQGSKLSYLTEPERLQDDKLPLLNDSQALKQYLKGNNISLNEFTTSHMQAYLNNGSSHYKARFSGDLAQTLNLNEYDEKTFIKMMNGECPLSQTEFDNIYQGSVKLKKGKQFINLSDKTQPGIDMLSSVPKSVSIEFARSNKERRDKIFDAMKHCDEEIFKNLALQVKPSCRKAEYLDFDPSKTKIFVASFTHYDNRSLEPHLHNHHKLANFAEFTFKDGTKKILAISTDTVFKCQKENSSIYDTLLTTALNRKGFKTEPAISDSGHETFRLKGYTQEIEENFSSRHLELMKFVEEQKQLNNIFSDEREALIKFKESYRDSSKSEKEEHVSANEMIRRLQNTVSKYLTPEEESVINLSQSDTSQSEKRLFDYDKIINSKLFETSAIVTETQLRTEIAKELRFSSFNNTIGIANIGIDVELANLANNKLSNFIVKTTDGYYTTIKHINNERSALDNLTALHNSSKTDECLQTSNQHHLDTFYETSSLKLNIGQYEACKQILKEKNLTVVIGDAGTGKTSSVIKFANEFYTSKNVNVIGLATQTSTAKDLNDADISTQFNTTSFLMKAFKNEKIDEHFLQQNRNSVLIVDEAGMVGAEHYNKLSRWAVESNSKIILVGDQKQLASVSYGNTFTQIQEVLPQEDIARLSINCRQRNEIAKSVAESFRDKKSKESMELLQSSGLLFTSKNQDDVAKNLADDYFKSEYESKLIICSTNNDCDLMNKTIRERLKTDKMLKHDIDFSNAYEIKVNRGNVSAKKEFCPGDDIVFLKNFKDKKKGIELVNSQRAKITNIKESGKNHIISCEVEGKSIEFSTDDFNSFNHSYAITSHKSQGKTCDVTFHFASSNTSHNKSYVDASRHREEYRCYIKEDEVERFFENSAKSQKITSTVADENCIKALQNYNSKHQTKNISSDTQEKTFERQQQSLVVKKTFKPNLPIHIREQARVAYEVQKKLNISRSKSLKGPTLGM